MNIKEKRNRLLTAVSVIIGVIAIVCVITIFTRYWRQTEQTNNTVATTNPTSITETTYIEFKPGTYIYEMVEKPEKTMWEFIYGVNKNDKITVATLKRYMVSTRTTVATQSTDTETYTFLDYNINIYRTESYIRPGYRYYIEIEDKGASILIPNYTIEVTRENIDDVWATIETAITDYNTAAEQVKAGELEYNPDTWLSIKTTISTYLDAYQTENTSVTKSVE